MNHGNRTNLDPGHKRRQPVPGSPSRAALAEWAKHSGWNWAHIENFWAGRTPARQNRLRAAA